jgi:magnesium transporter
MQNIGLNIDQLHYEDLLNRRHSSIFDKGETYDMFIMRLPNITNTDDIDVVSMGFILTKETSYFFNPQSNELEKLSKRFDTPYHMIDERLDNLLKAFYGFEDEISRLEELLYSDRDHKNFMSRWLKLKRNIVRIERVMVRASMVLKDIISHYKLEEKFPFRHYEDLLEHSERLYRSSTLQLSKLDYLYNFYNTRTNEKMNRLIFLLTIISGIFLPLNLFVGYFGMNTSGLPFTEGDHGTANVTLIMLLVTVFTVFLIMIWRKKIEQAEH